MADPQKKEEPAGLPTKSEVFALLAAVLGVDVGSISVVPPPEDPALAWQKRAADYEEAKIYLGPDSWKRFIAVTAATGDINFAARQSGMALSKINRRRDKYPEFDTAVVRAIEYWTTAVLEQTAKTRAIDGVLEPVFHQGLIRGYVVRYSDTLMNKLLEGNLPDKYKNRTELSMATGSVRILGGLPERPPEDVTVIEHAPQEVQPTEQLPPAITDGQS